MSKWYFSFDNAPLSLALQEKLDKAGLLRAIPTVRDASPETRFAKDFFTADGFPHMGSDMELSEVVFPYLFPAIAPWYDNATIPAAIMEMDALYRQSACEAALAWLFTLMEASGATNHIDTSRTFHGLAFQETIHGVPQTFCFPDTRIGVISKNAPAAVVLIADSYWNNEAWEKQSAVPLYARQQAQFQLWCWDRFADKLPADSPFCEEIPRTAIIVRISGNLSVDCTIRTVDYNPKEAFSLVDRICKAKAQEPQKGLYWKRNIETVQKWAEKIENEAYITENVDLHELIVEYMKARSTRKRIERELDEVSAKQDGIAMQLADAIPDGDIQGTLDLSDGTKCAVTHTRKRASSRSIPPDLVRSFFPHLDEFIDASGQERTTVTVNVL